MRTIQKIHARQILDSRSNLTLEVDVLTKITLWEVQLCHQVLLLANTNLVSIYYPVLLLPK